MSDKVDNRNSDSPKGLASIEIESVPLGYQYLNSISQFDTEIMDASVVGGKRFLILFRGDSAELRRSLDAIKKQCEQNQLWFDIEICDREPMQFLDSYHSMLDQKLAEALIVVSSSSLSSQLYLVNHPLKKLQLLEVKILRGAASGALGFYTGTTSLCEEAKDAIRAENAKSSHRQYKCECILNPNPKFRKFFNLSGEV